MKLFNALVQLSLVAPVLVSASLEKKGKSPYESKQNSGGVRGKKKEETEERKLTKKGVFEHWIEEPDSWYNPQSWYPKGKPWYPQKPQPYYPPEPYHPDPYGPDPYDPDPYYPDPYDPDPYPEDPYYPEEEDYYYPDPDPYYPPQQYYKPPPKYTKKSKIKAGKGYKGKGGYRPKPPPGHKPPPGYPGHPKCEYYKLVINGLQLPSAAVSPAGADLVTLGTEYIYNGPLFEDEDLTIPVGGVDNPSAFVTGSCTRFQASQQDNGNTIAGAGGCDWTYTFLVDEVEGTLEVSGELFDSVKSTMSIVGGTNFFLGAEGQAEYIPIYDDGSGTDVFTQASYYNMSAIVHAKICDPGFVYPFYDIGGKPGYGPGPNHGPGPNY